MIMPMSFNSLEVWCWKGADHEITNEALVDMTTGVGDTTLNIQNMANMFDAAAEDQDEDDPDEGMFN